MERPSSANVMRDRPSPTRRPHPESFRKRTSPGIGDVPPACSGRSDADTQQPRGTSPHIVPGKVANMALSIANCADSCPLRFAVAPACEQIPTCKFDVEARSSQRRLPERYRGNVAQRLNRAGCRAAKPSTVSSSSGCGISDTVEEAEHK